MPFDDIRTKGFHNRIELKTAIKACVDAFDSFPSVEVSIKDTFMHQKILRQDIYARRSIPPYNRSAVDGYAVRAQDTIGATTTHPITLKIIDKLNIGQIPGIDLEQNTAIHLPTGGIIPTGTTSIIKIEDTTRNIDTSVDIYASMQSGKNIIKAGEDVTDKQLMMKAGRRLQYIDRGYLLAAGITNILVSKTPSIGILVCGNELVEPWQKISAGDIPEVNSINLIDLCQAEGWKVNFLGIVGDHEYRLREVISQAVEKYDIVLVSGGTSVGEKDFIPFLYNEMGEMIFHGIAMRPGGPALAARIKNKLAFGIPGFPAAAVIVFQFMVKPIIQFLMGKIENNNLITIPATISQDVDSKKGSLDFLRVTLRKSALGEWVAVPLQISGSGNLRNLVEADGIIPIPISEVGLKQGELVEVILFSSL